jgi:hypothetical protein
MQGQLFSQDFLTRGICERLAGVEASGRGWLPL